MSTLLAYMHYAEAADRGHLDSMINAGYCFSGNKEKAEFYFSLAKEHYNEYGTIGKKYIDDFFE